MRKQLKNFEGYFFGLAKEDLKATASLVKAFMRAYYKELRLPTDNTITYKETEFIGLQHYHETQFIVHFGIWRLQSIFETLLRTEFKIRQGKGLKDILKALKEGGYIIPKRNELKEWVNLRNKLSHSAPERFHPQPTDFTEEDIDEFAELLLTICEDLEQQKAKKQKT